MLQFKNKEKTIEELKKIKRFTTLFSIIRLIMALSVVVFLVCLFSLQEYILYSSLSVGVFVLFLLIVYISNPIYKKEELLKNKIKCYLRHEQRREKNYTHFADTGIEFMDKEDYKLADLDVFGSKSLYQYLSEAKTPMGRNLLANQLKNPKDMGSSFKGLVNDLKDKEECLDLEASLAVFKKGSSLLKTDEFISLVSNKVEFKFKSFIPLLSFVGMISYLILVITMKINPYYIFVFLAFNLISSFLLVNDKLLQRDASSYYYLSDLYYDLTKTIQDTNFDNQYYQELKNKIVADRDNLKKIRSIYALLNIRRNLIINIILNILCSFNSILLIILKCRIKNGIKINESLEAIAILEVALSFKNIGFDNEYSTVGEESDKILGIQMYHPLVKNCIPNSLEFEGGIILTGSNMSGKTTFMRTLALCLLLNNAGSILPAESFKAPNLTLYTSLRANDMLSEGVSTFYAEIKRMKLINERIKNEKCLILVDEIFKGTNAMERIDASRRVIEKFNLSNQFFIISTHDFELCDTKDIINYHFEERYVDDKITFDYKIKEGPGKKGNAIYLLKLSGIIE